jgi:hypothetical protein
MPSVSTWARVTGGLACGCAGFLLSAEIVLRLLPVSTSTATGYHFDPLINTYPAHHAFTVSTGWDLRNAQQHRSNNYGYLDDKDFDVDPNAVAVIGDSYVEANMLPRAETLPELLDQRLGARRVFAMGAPGTSLLDYAERLRFAAENFGVRATLAPNTVLQPPRDGAKQLLSESAFLQYLFSQIRLDPGRLPRTAQVALAREARRLTGGSTQAPSLPRPALAPVTAAAIVEAFFEVVERQAPRTLVILYHSDRANRGRPDVSRDTLREAAARYDAEFVDVTAELVELEERTGLSVYVSPSDHHLNGLTLDRISEIVVGVLARQGQQ